MSHAFRASVMRSRLRRDFSGAGDNLHRICMLERRGFGAMLLAQVADYLRD